MSDLIKRSDAIKAVSKVDDYDDGIGFEVRSHCLVELELVPSADRPKGEWIPCSERLPSKHGEYLISSNGFVEMVYYGKPLMPTRKVKGKCFYVFDDDLGDVPLDTDHIEAWMPLPEPWEGADNE